jgi:hypothetical protein
MAKKTAAQIVEKFQRNLAASAPDYQAGVMNPSRPWAQATIASQPRWNAGVQKAISDGALSKGVQAAGEEKWQRRTATVGVERFGASAPAAGEEYGKKAEMVMQAAEAASRAANGMGDATIDQRIQRAGAAMKATSEYWRARKGRS